ncbi:hypothetical protein [Streptomyces sp. NPDC056191]|uniref:hypothetical protein n=1 Tax=Streptomyces sp. NPDC056191 TaxID=3345742 RepID=UPI0035DF62E0
MTDDRESSPIGPDSAYSDASIYVDAEAAPRVLGWLRDALGLNKEDGAELTVGPVRVYGAPNDYSTGRHAHPCDFLQWPTVLECESLSGAPAKVVQAVTAVLEGLWRDGFKAVAACGFEDELPARGGIDRYPLPSPSEGLSQVRMGRWKSLLVRGGKKKRNSA